MLKEIRRLKSEFDHDVANLRHEKVCLDIQLKMADLRYVLTYKHAQGHVML